MTHPKEWADLWHRAAMRLLRKALNERGPKQQRLIRLCTRASNRRRAAMQRWKLLDLHRRP